MAEKDQHWNLVDIQASVKYIIYFPSKLPVKYKEMFDP